MFAVKSEVVVQSEERLLYTSPWQRLGNQPGGLRTDVMGQLPLFFLFFFFSSFPPLILV